MWHSHLIESNAFNYKKNNIIEICINKVDWHTHRKRIDGSNIILVTQWHIHHAAFTTLSRFSISNVHDMPVWRVVNDGWCKCQRVQRNKCRRAAYVGNHVPSNRSFCFIVLSGQYLFLADRVFGVFQCKIILHLPIWESISAFLLVNIIVQTICVNLMRLFCASPIQNEAKIKKRKKDDDSARRKLCGVEYDCELYWAANVRTTFDSCVCESIATRSFSMCSFGGLLLHTIWPNCAPKSCTR